MNQIIYRQFGKPSGSLGRLAGWIMSFNNQERSQWTLEKLNVNPGDRLLEIGYGSGATLQKVAQKLTTGLIAGIDHSQVMFEQASARNAGAIKAGKIKLQCGTVWDLEYRDNYFDIAFGSNVHFFWENPVVEFGQLRKLVKPGGRVVMVFQPRLAKSEEEVHGIAVQTRNIYQKAGFGNIEIDFKKMKPLTCICISGMKNG